MATVEVHFKGIRKGYYRWGSPEQPLGLRDPVIVEAERGFDFGRVSAVGALAEKKCGGCSGCGPGEEDAGEAAGESALKAVIRRASEQEVRQADELRRGEDAVRRRVAERARMHGLDLKVADTEWQWDRKKLTVYFTAEHRVDFRALVRELAAQYHARIELRQIGVRDEAARLGGVGRCGREYCCSTWLKELSPVSLSLAKDQHLSLNPTQISGGCGRLLCCLRYEHDFYVAQRRRFPKEGKTVRTARGTEKVVAVDIFRERVFLRGEDGPRTLDLVDLKAEMEGGGERKEAAPPAPPAPAPEPDRQPERGKAEQAAAGDPSSPPESTSGARRKRRRRRGRHRRPGGGGSSNGTGDEA